MTTLILADDHPVVRRGLRALVESEGGMTVVGEAADGLTAVELVQRLQPDVLVVDLMMPGLSGLEVTRRVARQCPRTRTVILTMHSGESYVLEALRLGAIGFVLKDVAGDELVRAVREAAEGRRHLSPALSERALDAYVRRSEATPIDPFEALTAREREVLQLTAEGRTQAEIASRLFISPRTVEAHRGNLMRKLGLRHQVDLVRFALRRGLLPWED